MTALSWFVVVAAVVLVAYYLLTRNQSRSTERPRPEVFDDRRVAERREFPHMHGAPPQYRPLADEQEATSPNEVALRSKLLAEEAERVRQRKAERQAKRAAIPEHHDVSTVAKLLRSASNYLKRAVEEADVAGIVCDEIEELMTKVDDLRKSLIGNHIKEASARAPHDTRKIEELFAKDEEHETTH